MDPEQRFLATLEAQCGAAVAAAGRELLERANRLELAGRLTVCFSADAEGECIGFELPGPRQRARVLTIWCATGRARLDVSAPWLDDSVRAALLELLSPDADGDVALDARLADALERMAGG